MHNHNVAHLDLKPDNIVVARQPTDFLSLTLVFLDWNHGPKGIEGWKGGRLQNSN